MAIELIKQKANINLESEQDELNFKQALKGEKGDSGFSPIVEVIEAEEGHNVVITDNEGVKTFFVKDGESGTTLTSGDNTVVEDNAINVYTNTGYIISDNDIRLQPIYDNGTSGTNKLVYTDNEVMVIYNGGINIKRSENGIDFKNIRLPFSCKSMFYNPISKRIYGLCVNSYFIYSEDDGLTWQLKQHNIAGGADYICRTQAHIGGFGLINKASKKLYGLTENFVQNSGAITSTIVPEFLTQFAQHQFIWCNTAGTFKYGAGSQEGNFASLTLTGFERVSCLVNIEGYPIVGLNNSQRIFRLKNFSGVTDNEWVEYTLPQTCSVYDITFNPYDKTYYILTNVNTYFKTKDFIEYESIDADGLRGKDAEFTLMGIQATVENEPNKLLLAPTRTKLENKAQEWDRALDKSRWVGNGLELVGEQINVKPASETITVTASGIQLGIVDEYHITENMLKAIYLSLADLWVSFNPTDMETWFWESGFPVDDNFIAHKFIFSEAGTFYEQLNWEIEYTVEQYEYGYMFVDATNNITEYVKLGNLSSLLNKG